MCQIPEGEVRETSSRGRSSGSGGDNEIRCRRVPGREDGGRTGGRHVLLTFSCVV